MSISEAFSDFFYSAPDGLELHARVYGESISGPWPVACLPGLTRNARDFHELAIHLSKRAETPRKVVTFDYRGRGQSAYDADVNNYTIGVEAADILAGLSALGIEEAAFIGTSRGGLIIHILGMMQPSALKAIVFNDIGPVIEADGLAHIQSYLERTPTPKTFSEALIAQRGAHGQDFPALTDADWSRMVRALYRETDNGMVPDFDPKLVDTLAKLDLSRPLADMWPQFETLRSIPLLAIRGANSRLLSADTVRQMRERHPTMEMITVDGQGHAPFLESGTLPTEIAGFLARAELKSNSE